MGQVSGDALTDPSQQAPEFQAEEGGKSHEMLLEMLKTVHKAADSMEDNMYCLKSAKNGRVFEASNGIVIP